MSYESGVKDVFLFMVDTKRAQNMPDELDDIIIKKMIELNPKGFREAYDLQDANFMVGLAAEALTALKVREKTNKNDGYIVEMIQKVGQGQKGWPWCMYQVQACVGIAETLTGKVSKLPYSGSCAEVRNKADKEMVIEFGQSDYGSIWIKKYPDGTGHTGIFERWATFNRVGILNEGNTDQSTSVIREGGGSYRTRRSLDKSWVMCLRPFLPAKREVVKPIMP